MVTTYQDYRERMTLDEIKEDLEELYDKYEGLPLYILEAIVVHHRYQYFVNMLEDGVLEFTEDIEWTEGEKL